MVDQNTPDDFLPSIELFYFAYRAFTSRPDQVLEQRGLGRIHHRILYFVARKPGLAIKALQDTLQISKQALNAPLRQLVEMKLISVASATHDRRVKQLSLTEEGQHLEQQLTATQIKLFDAAFDSVGREASLGWRQVMLKMAAK